MKKLVTGAFVVLTAGFTYAQNSDNTVTQSGNNNTAAVTQLGLQAFGNENISSQTGNANNVNVYQRSNSARNKAATTQNGTLNQATVSQGQGFSAGGVEVTQDQDGLANTVTATQQFSFGSKIDQKQDGIFNTATSTQGGGDVRSNISQDQDGNFNTATASQSQTGYTRPTGVYSTANDISKYRMVM
ncbi:hypothetical protein [Chryseobacterium aquaticum]|uniref:Curlin n=1 Tax=Chryseobacterium aquaticum subsp. greenlandense TaxID=345663 RepID=A0A101CFB1_9FLAO|nr:hypothetical protein [Chryseobacterium aquaticum]KUJ54970.1 hypothetical protein AR686_15560 [Chryseobacterium aquaticum subsp. greenlandense]